MIVDIVCVDDIENLICCCKTFNTIGSERLQDHLLKKQKYSKITCGDWHQNENVQGTHPLQILCDIIVDRSVAFYPRTIQIGNYDFENDHLDDEISDTNSEDVIFREDEDFDSLFHNPEIRQLLFDFGDEITSEVLECQYLSSLPLEEVKENIESGKAGAALALLLTLLPDLRSIHILDYSLNSRYLRAVISRITDSYTGKWKHKVSSLDESWHRKEYTESYPAGFEIQPRALGKLSHVNLICTIHEDDDGDAGDAIEFIGPFMALPSIYSIYGRRFASYTSIWPPTFRSSVQKMEFVQSQIEADDFDKLLEAIDNLREFKYEFEGFFTPSTECEPAKLMASLRAYAHHSLVSLDFTLHAGPHLNEECDDKFVGHLKGFQTLQNLRLDNEMFMQYNGRENLDEDAALPAAVVPLWTLLPVTLETLTIAKPFGQGEAYKMLDGLPDWVKEKGAKLEKIVFEHRPDIDADFVEACMDAGIQLQLP